MTRHISGSDWSRREWLVAAGLGLAVARAGAAPAARVAVARCPAYGNDVLPALRKMFDGIGGIGSLVSGKTVAIKINMCNPLRARTGHRPAWFTRWSHPTVIAATVNLIGAAGAKRIRILEGSYEDDHPLEENILQGGWDPKDILGAAGNVEMENTDSLGSGNAYERLKVPGGGLVYPSFDCNHSYAKCDVLVSITKLKEHAHGTGVALTLNNLIGIAPASVYGDAAGFEEPAQRPFGRRGMFHTGRRQPPANVPAERDPNSPREPGYRLPRVAVDLAAARPVSLAIIDGIETQTSAEGATLEDSKRKIHLVNPGILVAGLNPVSTDAVGMALMGFDPAAARGTAPFEDCDSSLALAEQAGLGTRDLGQIEVVGTPIKSLQFNFRKYT